jgi:hypothetical protein
MFKFLLILSCFVIMPKFCKTDERYSMLLRIPKIKNTEHGPFIKFKKNRAHYHKYLLVNLVDAHCLNYVLYKIHKGVNGDILLNTDMCVVN